MTYQSMRKAGHTRPASLDLEDPGLPWRQT
jgi:hypothetical protein